MDTKKRKMKKKKHSPVHPWHAIVRKEGWDLIVQSSSSFDKALITLCTAFLGFIFAVVKWNNLALNKSLLIFVLVILIIAIVSSLLSFWFDQIYGDSKMNFADKYYSEKNDEYRDKKHWSYYTSIASKIIAGALFFFSLIIFTIFFFSNADQEKSGSANNYYLIINIHKHDSGKI